MIRSSVVSVNSLASVIQVFAYGSNMCLPRIRARVRSAVPVTTGYVTHRRLVFHKRGRDGSAKADIVSTGREADRVWGVVFSLSRAEKPALDVYETGYDLAEVAVTGRSGACVALTYVASAELIDPSLKPFSWYHGYVLHGAREHGLPVDYVDYLRTFETVIDPDGDRHHRNARMLGAVCESRHRCDRHPPFSTPPAAPTHRCTGGESTSPRSTAPAGRGGRGRTLPGGCPGRGTRWPRRRRGRKAW